MSEINGIPQNDHKISDKAPLLRSFSTPQVQNNTRMASRRISQSNQFLLHKSKIQDGLKNDNNVKVYENRLFDNTCEGSGTINDLSAMSLVSLYRSLDDLEYTMDTTREFIDNERLYHNIVLQCNPQQPDAGQQKRAQVNNNMYLEKNHVQGDVDEDIGSKNSCESRKDYTTPRIFFRDGIRSVDFVLVWDASEECAITPEAYDKRKIFERNLLSEGVELEYEPQELNMLNFVKIHAPLEVLKRYSDILKLRMPMKEIPALRQVSRRTNFIVDGIENNWLKIKKWLFEDSEMFTGRTAHRFTAIYSRDREYLFDTDAPGFFTPAVHSRIVQFILDRKRFSQNFNNDFAFGIERLINEKAYSAAYPLHDGDLDAEGTTRNLLYEEWASVRKWYKYQPLDYVKEYFGVKIALYFAWLGYYTNILLAPAVGLACFIYSLSTLYDSTPSNDICNMRLKHKMCPLCDDWCNYWDLKETCIHSRITYLFDNGTTVFYAIFMSIWATTFLEMWKRYSAEITHRWDLTGFDVQEEHPRPQYLARLAHVKRKSVNVVTNTMEPQVPFWKIKVPMTIFSFSMVILLVCLALATVVAVVLYRMSMLVALKVYSGKMNNSLAILLTTVTAASINLVAILIFNKIYDSVAEYLTEVELLRTQTEFDDSLTLKIYLLQIVNYYASIFYIAFFKGRFIGSPKKYNRLFGYRQEECGPGGCLLELCIQLAVIMIGKQTMNSFLEMLFPLFLKWMNTLKLKTGLSKDQTSCKGCRPQWTKDFKLVEWGPRSLFPEYLEMVLQYGFVTIFVAAFPLAPFFALLNNILEMRLDAKKLLGMYRRPVSQRVRDIGVWYRILDSIGKLSVITNGFIIAFTSDFIPRLVYRISVSSNGTLEGYLNNSLSYFNTSHFQSDSMPRNNTQEICRYPDYRNPPWVDDKYEPTALYWHILAARLTFVVIFENLVVIVMIVVKWCIPDMPGELRDRIRREAYLTNEIIIKQECLRAQNPEANETQVKAEKLRNIQEVASTPQQWDRLIDKSLSASDFDLMVHGDRQQRQSDDPETPYSI